MAVTTETLNGKLTTFAGNFVGGDAWSGTALLAAIRTGLGSNDRANINQNDPFSIFRIDWRTNESTTDETLTGVIPVPPGDDINNFATLAANARMALSLDTNNFDTAIAQLVSGVSPLGLAADGGDTTPNFTSGAEYWAFIQGNSLSFFVKQGSLNYFFSQGILENPLLTFPNGLYALGLRTTGTNNRINGGYRNAGAISQFFVSTAVANYAHNDGAPTTDEVEMYCRIDASEQQFGFIPGVIKVTVDGALVAPSIGDILTCDFSAATNFYNGYGTRKVIIVGQLGNTSETDLTGDFLAMIVAG